MSKIISDIMEDVHNRFDYNLVVAFELHYKNYSDTRDDELFESEAEFKIFDQWYNNVLDKQERKIFDEQRARYDKQLGLK